MQERQFPPFESQDRRLSTRGGRSRPLARALASAVALTGVATLALVITGCPSAGELENPGTYCAPGKSVIAGAGVVVDCLPPGTGGSSSAGSGAGGSGTMANCETDCVKAIVTSGAAACKVCHAANPAARLDMGTLDMESPGLSARLKDQPSSHKGLMDTSGCPMGDKIIDSANPANSWLLKKIKGQQGSCGTVMPSTGALSPADQTCMETFVNCVAGGSMPGASGSASGGTASGGGGSGGAAAGSGGTATSGSGGTGGA